MRLLPLRTDRDEVPARQRVIPTGFTRGFNPVLLTKECHRGFECETRQCRVSTPSSSLFHHRRSCHVPIMPRPALPDSRVTLSGIHNVRRRDAALPRLTAYAI